MMPLSGGGKGFDDTYNRTFILDTVPKRDRWTDWIGKTISHSACYTYMLMPDKKHHIPWTSTPSSPVGLTTLT